MSTIERFHCEQNLLLHVHVYPQLNVRHLKAGIRMVPSIAALGRKCAHALIKHGVIEKLCELLVAKHMASPLKLLSLKAVDSLLDFPQGIERFLGWTELQVGNCVKCVCVSVLLIHQG